MALQGPHQPGYSSTTARAHSQGASLNLEHAVLVKSKVGGAAYHMLALAKRIGMETELLHPCRNISTMKTLLVSCHDKGMPCHDQTIG